MRFAAQRLYREARVAFAVSPFGGGMAQTERILVTGGGGFIGTSLVKELISRGHEVIASDLDNRDQEGYVRCDVRAFRQVEGLIQPHHFDYVYHLAAEYGRWNGEDYYENLWQTN